MKNFEKDFDKLLNNLRVAKDILAEFNIEMQKALGEARQIKYAIRCKTTCAFYNREFDMWFCDIDCASIFKSREYAKVTLDTEIQGNEENYEIVQIQLKVVE